ncbi:hypothetical protein F4604DRAFT_1687603 [Suillus subluteus]|nr:hypothetical protein F4604DRAFT_1687603 [Suillus subluteus]
MQHQPQDTVSHLCLLALERLCTDSRGDAWCKISKHFTIFHNGDKEHLHAFKQLQETQECLEVVIICIKEIASQILQHMKEGCVPVQEQGETSSGADEQGLVIDLQAYRTKVERSQAGNFSKIFKTSSFGKGQYGDGIAESAVPSVDIYEKCSETWKIWLWGASQLTIRLAIITDSAITGMSDVALKSYDVSDLFHQIDSLESMHPAKYSET